MKLKSNRFMETMFPGHRIRTVRIDGQTWYVGLDVTRALDMKRGDSSVLRLPPEWKRVMRVPAAEWDKQAKHSGGNLRRDMTVIPLAGVVWVAARSHKRDAPGLVAGALAPLIASYFRTGVAVAGDSPEERCKYLSRALAKECSKVDRLATKARNRD